MHFTCVSYRHPYCGDSPFPCLSVIPQIRTRQFPRSVRPVVRWSCETASTGPCMLSRGTVEKMSEDDCRESQCLGKWPSCISISSSPRRTIWCSHTFVPIQSRLKPRRHQDLSMCKPHDPSLGTATYQTDRGTVDYNCPCRNTKPSGRIRAEKWRRKQSHSSWRDCPKGYAVEVVWSAVPLKKLGLFHRRQG